MARAGGGHACEACGYRSAKWLGRCPACESWDTLRETSASGPVARPATALENVAPPEDPRLPTGVGEFDRVLGGGLVPGSAVLVGGEPGVGKSTLLLQAAARLAADGRRVLYTSGEESAAQIRLRADRLGVSASGLTVLCEQDVAAIAEAVAAEDPALVVIDSIQTVRDAEATGTPGSVQQVRQTAARLIDDAKRRGHVVVLVGHVTKDGTLAGPRALEHAVDCVLQFDGDRGREHRLLRGLKNRFGPTDELGVFRMTADGLAEVPNPSERLLSERSVDAAGSAVTAAVEGRRALLVEVQALVGEARPGTPRRTSLGIDGGRLAMILAVLERADRVSLADRDVFVNVTGGLTLRDPAADLAVAAAVASSLAGIALPSDTVLFGEIGLTGELRGVTRVELRLREAARLGFGRAVLPSVHGDVRCEGPTRIPCARLETALRGLREAQIG